MLASDCGRLGLCPNPSAHAPESGKLLPVQNTLLDRSSRYCARTMLVHPGIAWSVVDLARLEDLCAILFLLWACFLLLASRPLILLTILL